MYRYLGIGEHYEGVPARDLSAADVARLDDAQRALVAASPLYRAEAPSAATEPSGWPAPAEFTVPAAPAGEGI